MRGLGLHEQRPSSIPSSQACPPMPGTPGMGWETYTGRFPELAAICLSKKGLIQCFKVIRCGEKRYSISVALTLGVSVPLD